MLCLARGFQTPPSSGELANKIRNGEKHLLMRTLGSQIRGGSIHNVNSHRAMYTEMIEKNVCHGPKLTLNKFLIIK